MAAYRIKPDDKTLAIEDVTPIGKTLRAQYSSYKGTVMIGTGLSTPLTIRADQMDAVLDHLTEWWQRQRKDGA